jgi:hypothetical protein
VPIDNPTSLPSDGGATLSDLITRAAEEGTVLFIVLGSNLELEGIALALSNPPISVLVLAGDRNDVADVLASLPGQTVDAATDQGCALSIESNVCDVIHDGEPIIFSRVQLAYASAQAGC